MSLEESTDLFGFLLDVDDFVIPVTEVGPHEFINLRKKLISDHGGRNERKHGPSHRLVKGAVH